MIQEYSNTKTDVVSLLKKVYKNGISVFVEDEKLKLKTSKDKKPDKEIIQALKNKKQDIIDFLKKETVEFKRLNGNSSIPPIVKRTSNTKLPLSFSQQALWTVDHFSGSIPYHMPAVFRFKGDLNLNNLEAAFNAIVNRHEILRTVYIEKEGEVYQEVLSGDEWRFESSKEIATIKEADLEQCIYTLLEKPFDLSKDKMLRAKVYKVSEDDYVLIVVIHHIAADGWSLPVLLHELKGFYQAFTRRESASLMSLPIQYSDFALWQKTCFENGLLDKHLEYWDNKLSGTTPLNLPLDKPRPAVQSANGKTLNFQIGADARKKLEQLAKNENVTLN